MDEQLPTSSYELNWVSSITEGADPVFENYKLSFDFDTTVDIPLSISQIKNLYDTAVAAYPENKAQPGSDSSLKQMASILPGVQESVQHPVNGCMYDLFYLIINLNDDHKWTREQIADWLETLDVDLTFPVQCDESKKGELV